MPEWARTELAVLPQSFASIEERMAVVIRFSRLNFERGTGGPFAAGVFEQKGGKLLSIGVNRVVSMQCSSAHAEVMALSIAQKMIGTYDLGGADLQYHQLVINWRPCSMCYGATLWSGVRSLVIAGSDKELEKITGFDEGPMPADWRGELEARNIQVFDNVLREQAVATFRDFAASNSLVYNARLGSAMSK